MAGAWWHNLRPGQYFEVEYADDEVAHERLALWPLSPDAWAIRNPDGDEWIEHLDNRNPEEGPITARVRREGRRAGGGLLPLYQFREKLEGRSRKGAMIRGLRIVLAEAQLEMTPVVTEMVDLITASRAYEANISAVQAAKDMYDTLMGIV